MSQCAPAHNEAGPSSGAARYDTSVRRSKTIHHPSSSNSRPHTSAASTLDQLALPFQLNTTTRRSSHTVNDLRDPTVSPSKRGETLRAYSRQRRVFSGNEHGATTSPEQLTRALPAAGPASPSMRRPHPSRNFAGATGGMTESIASSLLFSSGADETDSLGFGPMLNNPHLEALADEASSFLSSTPSLTSPTSTLSRSTSLRSAGSERNTLMGSTRYLSLNGSADLPTTMEGLSPEYGASNWTRRARRWSNSMSRRMSITALNQTIHSTTSPYLKAGLQELRSIFDVDTLGVAVDDQEDEGGDLEGASPKDRSSSRPHEQDRLSLFAAAATAASRDQAVFESPETISPVLSRQSSSEDRELPTQLPGSRPSISFKSQIYEAPVAHRRAQSWRKHRSLSISDLPNRSLIASAAKDPSSNMHKSSSSSSFSSTRDGSTRSQSVRTPLVAVGLAALSVTIIGVCAFETSIHPDAASLPLTAFMLAQSVFALVGISGLALQRRWLIDLASRLIRAHVLCQVLIALAALRSLSRTAFYRDRMDRQSFNGTAAAGILTSPRFLASSSHAVDPHMSVAGSFRDQATYVCVFIVQAALPLAFVFWAQYTIASALSRATRHLPSSANMHKDHPAPRQQSVPTVKVAHADAGDVPRNERMRFNSENPSVSKASSFSMSQRSEGWLGFVITRLDVNPPVSTPPKFELDAAELTRKLQVLARADTASQRTD